MGWQPDYRAKRDLRQIYAEGEAGRQDRVLYQNDDFGKDYLEGPQGRARRQGRHDDRRGGELRSTEPTVDSRSSRSRPNPDVLRQFATPKFAAQAIRKIAELDWKPLQFLTNVSISVGAVMKPAGFENAQGMLTAAYLKDAADKQWKNDAGMKKWRPSSTNTCRAPTGPTTHSSTATAGPDHGEVLKMCGDDLTRENVMKQAASLRISSGHAAAGYHDHHQSRPISPRSTNADDALQGRDLGAVRRGHQWRRRKQLSSE